MAKEAKALTKAQLVGEISEKLGITKKDVSNFFDALTDIAYKETKKKGEFTMPGFGKLVKVAAQGPHRPQSRHRRNDQDQGKDRCEIPRGQGLQGCHHPGQVISGPHLH